MRKWGARNQAPGRSRGGLSAKIHMLTDAVGWPVRFILTGGQAADSPQGEPLLAGIDTTRVIADKEYDSGKILASIQGQGAVAVIPPTSNRKTQREYSRELHWERNMIERAIN